MQIHLKEINCDNWAGIIRYSLQYMELFIIIIDIQLLNLIENIEIVMMILDKINQIEC